MTVPPGMPTERIVETFRRRCRLQLLSLSFDVVERRANEFEASQRELEQRHGWPKGKR